MEQFLEVSPVLESSQWDDYNDNIFDIFWHMFGEELTKMCVWRDHSPTSRLVFSEVRLVPKSSRWDNSNEYIFLTYLSVCLEIGLQKYVYEETIHPSKIKFVEN